MEKAKTYKMNFIQPGLCGYTAEGDGIVLVQKPALDRMAESFKGMPIFNEHHTDLPKDELIRAFKQDSVGVVSNIFWNPETAWYEGEIIIWDKKAAENIESGKYFPSCAYMPSAQGINDEGGQWHNVHYDAEILDGEYTHLAIVTNPRYEGAKFFNSKGENRMRIFNVLKNSKEDEKEKENIQNDVEKKEKNNSVNLDDVVDIDGEQIKISDLVDKYKKINSEKENALSPQDKVEIEPGLMVTVQELIDTWKKSDEDNTDVPDTGADTEPQPKEKQNSKSVNLNLKKALLNSKSTPIEVETMEDRIKIGNQRYSLKEGK